jgi:hypothetical protein
VYDALQSVQVYTTFALFTAPTLSLWCLRAAITAHCNLRTRHRNASPPDGAFAHACVSVRERSAYQAISLGCEKIRLDPNMNLSGCFPCV